MGDRETYALRRGIYLTGLPLSILACLMAWLIEEPDSLLASFDRVALPILAAWLLGLSIAFLLKKQAFRFLEVAFFLGLWLFFLTRLGFLLFLSHTGEHTASELSDFGYWFPVLYALAFLIFGVRLGTRISLLFFAITIAAGGFHLSSHAVAGEPLIELYTFSQIFVSDAILILLLVAFAKLTAEMEHLARTDGLTKLSNRRRLEELLNEEIMRARCYQRPLSVLLVDLDHFKRINDTHGHDAGDDALRRLADLLRAQIRSTDHLGRWGGEEFLIILPENRLEEAERLASRLKLKIEQYTFRTGRLTASFGVAEFREGDSPEALMKRADRALYQAKSQGGNAVIAAVA